MIAFAIWPAVFVLVGLLVYVLSANPKFQELGRILFFCGVFFVTALLTSQALHFPLTK